ncbi:MAG: hypothetical protein DSZ27_00455 [Thiomicrospira sp.]|nr:MAG: hypothetical protein DSZ27_00455 [Thiomicrospira sp.]
MDNLIIGTQGWESESWLDSFYPEDMPEDWRLDYYSNFFECVLVEESVWRSWSEEMLEELADMLEGESFWFFLELVSEFNEQSVHQLQKIKQILQDQASGIILKNINQELPENLKGYTVTLVSKTAKKSGWCWEYEGVYVSGEPVGFVEKLNADGKVQSSMLKQFMQSLPNELNGAPFFVGGEKIDIDQVKNLKIVGEIMGY